VVLRQSVQLKEIKMRNTALTILGALLVTCSTVQLSMASEHQAHKARNFRGAYNQLNDPAYEAPATGYGWSTGGNWRDAAKFSPAGN
jgi:hypothetical protein